MLDPTTYATIKAGVNADQGALALWNAANPGACCDYLNSAPSTGPVLLTREDVSNTELFHALVTSDVASLQPWQLTMLQLAGQAGTIDFTNPNIASGLAEIFPNTTKTYANIMAMAQRPATRLEAMFTNNGVCSQYRARIDVNTLLEAMK